MIKAFWHQSDNFGDKLTPYILKKLGVPFEYTAQQVSEEHYIMCGSILTACNSHSIIWGAGIAQPYDLQKPKEIIAVRGSKTRDFLLSKGIDCPELYGDPAMLLPLLYNPKREKKRTFGIIPHIADERKPEHWRIEARVEDTIDYILESEHVRSSSLHVLVAAHVYGVPYSRIKSDAVIGGDFKFIDFFDTDYNTGAFINSFPFKKYLDDYSREVRA